MARLDQWEPRNSGSPKRKVWQTVGWFVLILMFMGAAFAAITRPLPPIHVSKHHPHITEFYVPGVQP
ncbi:hypothetical protein [Alicyclobacillus sp. ALC3]|uniref:hypothetical protein n=1 Tax=Alicyclobacillus sp. ALC3 TaxID=2796143 RepID=UPI002378FC52|nr:hypothetical protein [Alicyclobacillus sp. ALC3]WDL97830.1 hypothetical protein JC200_03610 [Alicyclobacillus sp. ALC3]